MSEKELFDIIRPQVIEKKTKEEKKDKSIGLFDFVNDISFNKENICKIEMEKTGLFPKNYNQYLINMAFGNFPDTILFANEMNKKNIPDFIHYIFLFNVIPKKKRFAKWYKEDNKKEECISSVMRYYGCSKKDAMSYMQILDKDTLNEIYDMVNKESKNR